VIAIVVGAAAIWVWSAVVRASLYPVRPLADHAPRETRLMVERRAEAARAGRRHRIDQRWVPASRISPLLRRAVLTAEDDRFFGHGGLDWSEMRESARRNVEARRVVRGGSTITQQLAKNLFLGSARTPDRKLQEVIVALRMERILSKRRILELYLNLIEWGDGVYGAEAAARRTFGVSAANLDARQAVLLAAVIINPRRYSAAAPSRRIESRARMIASRMHRRGALDDEQYALAIGKPLRKPGPLDWLFGPKTPEPDTAGLGAQMDSVVLEDDTMELDAADQDAAAADSSR
jgi:monofunctional biosynthetic peptidoglycan transglycosylase